MPQMVHEYGKYPARYSGLFDPPKTVSANFKYQNEKFLVTRLANTVL
jgi:hypothetical protein